MPTTTQPIPTGYKTSPLGPIPQDWEFDKLGSLGKFNTSSVDKVIVKGEKIVNLLNYMDVYRNRYINSNFNFLETSVKESELKTFNLKNGDVMFTPSSETPDDIGHSSVITEDLKDTVFSYHLIRYRLESDKKLSVPFRGYVFNNFLVRKEFFKKATGSTRYTLSKNSFENSFVIYPKSLPEQTAIATILSTVDTTIQQTQEMIRKFSLRNKGLQQNLLFKKEDKNWKKIKLDNFLIYTPRPVEKPSENFFALGIRSHGKGIFHKNDFDPEDIAMDVLYEVKENDLIVNITFAREQAIAIAGKQDDGGLVSHRFPTYTFKPNKAIPEYFRYLIIQKKFKYMLDLISPGGAGRNRVLSKKDFLKLEVVIPSVEEQEKIANILNKATQQLNQYKQKLEKLQNIKKGLMQQLLTGKVRAKIK